MNVSVGASLTFGLASVEDAKELAVVRNAAARRLTDEFGPGHWSLTTTEKIVARAIRRARVLVARDRDRIVATLRLATSKPWAIDASRFTPVKRPVYLLDMAVEPDRQRQGIGRALLREALAIAHAWPVHAIRLDAYDDPAGAGDFYARCGYTEVGRVVYRTVPLVYYERLL